MSSDRAAGEVAGEREMATGRARLFVALDLPPEARAALLIWGRAQLGDMPGVRLVAPEALHITLCFLGSREVAEVGEIGAACRSALAAARSGPAAAAAVRLTPGEALWLPRRRPHVVAVGLTGDVDALAALQSRVAGALHAGGFYEPEDRPFLGHVTVGRIGRNARVRAGAAPPEPVPFTATDLTLYRSHVGGGPARYEALVTIPLAGA